LHNKMSLTYQIRKGQRKCARWGELYPLQPLEGATQISVIDFNL
jgi:hypothetical protein